MLTRRPSELPGGRRSSELGLQSPLAFKQAYNAFRKTDFAKLKFICANALEKMSSFHLLDLAIDICKKPCEERLIEEIRILIKATENMPFFQEINKKNSNIRMNTHEKICSLMTYESKKKGSAVINFGDQASKFYIILKGSVNVYVPRDKKTLSEDVNSGRIPDRILKKMSKWRAEFRDFLAQNPLNSTTLREKPHHMKNFIALQRKATAELNPEIVKKLAADLTDRISQDQLEDQSPSGHARDSNDSIGKHSELFSENDREIMKKIEIVLGNLPLMSLENPEKYFENGVFKFHFIAELKAGQIFGEVGLSMKKTRSATVICNQDCEFAVLSCEDFNKVLQNVEKRNIENRVAFFRESVFKGISVDVVVRMSLLFKKRKFSHGTTIYSEGDEASEMFLIKRGEVQILKRVREKKTENETTIQDFLTSFRKKSENRVTSHRYFNVSVAKLIVGQYFGEDDILRNTKRSTTAVAVSSKVTLFYISKLNFLKILNENEVLHQNFLSNYQLKSSWLKNQVHNCIIKRATTSAGGNKTESSPKRPFPIRREIEEIFGVEQQEVPADRGHKKSLQGSFSRISSIKPQRKQPLRTNKIVDIVGRNEKTLEGLIKIGGRVSEGNPFQALVENERTFSNFSKMMSLRKGKYKNYGSGDPLDTCLHFNFNKFLQKKIKGLVESSKHEETLKKESLLQYEGFLSDRKRRKPDLVKEILTNGIGTSRLTKKIGLRVKEKNRSVTALAGSASSLGADLKIEIKGLYKNFME